MHIDTNINTQIHNCFFIFGEPSLTYRYSTSELVQPYLHAFTLFRHPFNEAVIALLGSGSTQLSGPLSSQVIILSSPNIPILEASLTLLFSHSLAQSACFTLSSQKIVSNLLWPNLLLATGQKEIFYAPEPSHLLAQSPSK